MKITDIFKRKEAGKSAAVISAGQQTTVSELPSGAWLVVAMLMVVGCLNYIVRIMITNMRGSLTEAMPLTDAQFGLLTSVFLWVYGIVSPFAGFLSDRFKRSHVIIVSLVIWSIVTWSTSLARTFDQLLFTRVIMGLSEACYIPAALALIADYHRGPTRSFATGLHIAGILIGQTLSFTGGWLAEKNGWTFPFKFYGIVGVAYAVAVLLPLLRDVPHGNAEPVPDQKVNGEGKVRFTDAISSLFSSGSFILQLIYFGIMGISWVLIGWLPTYFREHFNLSQSLAGLYATAYPSIAGFIGVLIGGAWADRWSRTNIRARIFVPVIGLCAASPAIFLSGTTGILPLAIFGFVFISFTLAFNEPNMMPVLCLVSDTRYRATGYGILNLAGCIMGGIGIFISGVLLDAKVDFNVIFRMLALIIGANSILLLLVKPSRKF
jgi:MFS family permease